MMLKDETSSTMTADELFAACLQAQMFAMPTNFGNFSKAAPILRPQKGSQKMDTKMMPEFDLENTGGEPGPYRTERRAHLYNIRCWRQKYNRFCPGKNLKGT